MKEQLHNRILLLFIGIFSSYALSAQLKIHGTVYDGTRTFPLEAVSVLTTSGRGTVTNATGFYEIEVAKNDSIWFSYLNKPTIKFPVAQITNRAQFDISLQVEIPVLKEVRVMPKNYKLDSIQNRLDYAKAFNFRRPNVESMTSTGAMGAGIDINEVIRLFQFRKNNSMMRFRERLLQQEKDKFIDHRFNKALVRRLTKLEGEGLNNFMSLYRPAYEFVLYSSDYDFQDYIRLSYKKFRQQKSF
ncbi:MAG: hypothetical protein ABR502_06530 [Chitinophagaceae bacterium]